MQRREFMTLAGGAVVWPLAARAQQPAMPVIGLLNGVSFNDFADQVAAFRQGLKDTGLVEGQNVTIEYRSADAQAERLPALAADLVRRQVAVIVAIGTPTPAQAAKAVTSTIPIVFAMGGDAIDYGLVTTLNRPEANVTGMSFATSQLAPKRLELLRELVPQVILIGYLVNSRLSPSTEPVTRDLVAAALTIGRKIVVLEASTEQEIDTAFATMVQLRVGALVVSPDAFFFSRRNKVVALAARHAVPAIYAFREYAAAGGLMSYGAVISDMYRQAGIYTGRILKGEKPADLPVQAPTRFELVIHLRTAKALGLEIPPKLLALADEVIE